MREALLAQRRTQVRTTPFSWSFPPALLSGSAFMVLSAEHRCFLFVHPRRTPSNALRSRVCAVHSTAASSSNRRFFSFPKDNLEYGTWWAALPAVGAAMRRQLYE